MDIASLLIALLRASDYPARYVRGTIAIEEDQARNWVGNAPDLDTAARIFAKGGVPVSVSEDERLVKEHVWVEVNVAGADSAEREWVGLDASFKQFDYRTPTDFTEITGFNAERWTEDAHPLMFANDRLQAVSSLPELISPDLPDESRVLKIEQGKARHKCQWHHRQSQLCDCGRHAPKCCSVSYRQWHAQ